MTDLRWTTFTFFRSILILSLVVPYSRERDGWTGASFPHYEECVSYYLLVDIFVPFLRYYMFLLSAFFTFCFGYNYVFVFLTAYPCLRLFFLNTAQSSWGWSIEYKLHLIKLYAGSITNVW